MTHLDKAKDYIGRGEEFFRKAADEIRAAMDEDFQLSYRTIGDHLGRNESWVRRLVTWSTNAPRTATPFAEDAGRLLSATLIQ